MSASTTEVATAALSVRYGQAFWERLWRLSGVGFVGFSVIVAVLYGYLPSVGATPDAIVDFYSGEQLRILAAATLSCLNVLNLMWFAAALRVVLADADQGGWGAAATASSAAFGALTVLAAVFTAALAYAIARPGGEALSSGLNSLSWALAVLISFPRTMLIMSAAFGLWRAGLISNALFAVGVGAVVLGVLGGTTWVAGGLWSPDGVMTRFVSPLVFLAWMLVASRVLLAYRLPARTGW
jgi:hypothetical protein